MITEEKFFYFEVSRYLGGEHCIVRPVGNTCPVLWLYLDLAVNRTGRYCDPAHAPPLPPPPPQPASANTVEVAPEYLHQLQHVHCPASRLGSSCSLSINLKLVLER